MDRIKPSATVAMTPEQIERLRDEFAMSVMTGLLANGQKGAPSDYAFASMARSAYAIADAMLHVRQAD